MQTVDALTYVFDAVNERVHAVLSDAGDEVLQYRPDAGANTVAWLLWHLSRIMDDHVMPLAGRDQVWVAGAWAEHFGLRGGTRETGFGHSPDDVAAVRPADAQVVRRYHDEVADAVTTFLDGLDDADLDRVVDRSYDPPVTLGVRLLSVAMDALQHVGQAAYVAGLAVRRV